MTLWGSVLVNSQSLKQIDVGTWDLSTIWNVLIICFFSVTHCGKCSFKIMIYFFFVSTVDVLDCSWYIGYDFILGKVPIFIFGWLFCGYKLHIFTHAINGDNFLVIRWHFKHCSLSILYWITAFMVITSQHNALNWYSRF